MQRTAAAAQPGSNELRLRVGWSSMIAQVDVFCAVFNRRVCRWKPSLPPPPLVVMLKVNKSLSGPDDSIH